MSKAKSLEYVCQSCGASAAKWSGKCYSCNSWNTLEQQQSYNHAGMKSQSLRTFVLNDTIDQHETIPSRIGEFDRCIGGGLVPGGVILMSGDPGIGKSTLLLQIAAKYSQGCLYVSGEEGVSQIQMRAKRLHLASDNLHLAATNNLNQVLAIMEDKKNAPRLLIIDSIQTLYSAEIGASMGSVGQIRHCTHEIIEKAKAANISVIIVGHITKDGNIAGPKLLEHMVDTVLHFEGDNTFNLRILRSLKNRFGPIDEIGVFEMASDGMREISNPSLMFLNNNYSQNPGSVVFAASEGSRPILVEIQALVVKSHLSMPRRDVIGWDHNRLAMILAVLESKCNLNITQCDIYLNVTGGVRLRESAVDLAVAIALMSSKFKQQIDGVFVGEIGLSGEIRTVPKIDLRIRESQKLGFETIYLPQTSDKKLATHDNMNIVRLSCVQQLLDLFDDPRNN